MKTEQVSTAAVDTFLFRPHPLPHDPPTTISLTQHPWDCSEVAPFSDLHSGVMGSTAQSEQVKLLLPAEFKSEHC